MSAFLLSLGHPPLALFEMLGGSEVLVVFLIILVFFGGEKMPEFARTLAKVLREFKKAASGVEQEFKRAMEEDPANPPPAQYTPPVTPSILPPPAATDTPAPEAATAPASSPHPADPDGTPPVAPEVSPPAAPKPERPAASDTPYAG